MTSRADISLTERGVPPGTGAERRRRIDELLQAALDVDDPGERRSLLDRSCPGDLRADVDRLLDACCRSEPMPSVAKLRIEALYAFGRDEVGDEFSDTARQPRSPWQSD